jgi:hypothetical protein
MGRSLLVVTYVVKRICDRQDPPVTVTGRPRDLNSLTSELWTNFPQAARQYVGSSRPLDGKGLPNMLARLLENSCSARRRRDFVRGRQLSRAPQRRLRLSIRHAGVALRLPDDSLKLTEQLGGGPPSTLPDFP